MGTDSDLDSLDPVAIDPNPNNPRKYFNEDKLDLLRTSIQEVGILVPLIVCRSVKEHRFVLMDGERRWRCSIDLGLATVPANIIETPSRLDNLLRMFNIHNVREDWPLVSVALSLRNVIEETCEHRESRLAELTGLTRSTVRRAKRILSLPEFEIELIQNEAHLDRNNQVHREDLYLEIEAAESVLRNRLSEISEEYGRDRIIRQFAAKAEEQSLTAVTDFRYVGKLLKMMNEGYIERAEVVLAARRLVAETSLSPRDLFEEVAAARYEQHSLDRKAERMTVELDSLTGQQLAESLRERLIGLRDSITRLLTGS
ncbi:ParB/RepB/Spo0J family partition protein [Candidatus Poriferisodalis sp.]|uniref:ParB/RepB/Spo0J family partition protein n=1 Tax=Candidatus Poriferisodalis sp. TaxID=3101277 RepID=UPI003B5B1746